MIAVLFGVFAALCWSIHDVIARSIAGAVGGFRTAAWVMVSGFVLLSAYVLWDGSVWQASGPAIFSGLLLGFVVTFGLGWFARDLDFIFLGWGFNFWLAAQGALLVYLLIVTGYAWIMNRLDDHQLDATGRPPA